MNHYPSTGLHTLLRVMRKSVGLLGMRDQLTWTDSLAHLSTGEANRALIEVLLSSRPAAVARFGNSELLAILTYLAIRRPEPKILKLATYISGYDTEPFWTEYKWRLITFNAGIFPDSLQAVEDAIREMIKTLGDIDLLGSWLWGEKLVLPWMPQTRLMRHHDFYPMFHDDPWTGYLEHKKVLVIHPFANTIRQQYERRIELFDHPRVLPAFRLSTISAVQSIAGSRPQTPEGQPLESWSDALDWMTREALNKDFDVALIGCGAYGQPLAVRLKRAGKIAIHVGGMLQFFFGIRGLRWERDPTFSRFINEAWVKPSDEETPSRAKGVEDGCYW